MTARGSTTTAQFSLWDADGGGCGGCPGRVGDDAGEAGAEAPDLASYDHVIVAFSGGKDSVACVTALLDAGVDPAVVELWHHPVDGREGSDLMDWPVTPSYCRAFAAAFGLPLYESWREGGIEREMLREDAPTAAVRFEAPGGGVEVRGGTSPNRSTRLMFPQVSADLSVRWCSSVAKIDVASVALRNQDRFLGRRTLFVTGERAQESPARARYRAFEPHRTDNRAGRTRRRHVDHWRPVHGWDAERVWAAFAERRVNPHPAYRAGFGRVSCRFCIFGSEDQLATLGRHAPAALGRIADYERRFGRTIHRTKNVLERAAAGKPYAAATDAAMALCHSTSFDEPILLDAWTMPAGAFAEAAGPT